jgi:hypothetical protein
MNPTNMNKGRDEFISKLVPKPLRDILLAGRFMSIGDSIYEVSVKLQELSNVPGNDHEYAMDFRPIGLPFVKTVCVGSEKGMTKAKVEKLIYTKHNFSAEYPIPCNLKEQFEFRVKGVIWNSYKYPQWDYRVPDTELEVEENCKTTLQLFRHIYGSQLELGLDAMTVEFMFPTHPLPAQILFSRENKTGKSTLLFYKKTLYGSNATIIDNNTFGDKFNAPMAGKVFVGIDEGDIKGNGGIDKIKNLITAPTMQLRAMHQAATEVPNYSKWSVATNNELFAKLDKEDTRFWIIEVPKLAFDYDPSFKSKLRSEIPYWIGFLKKRWELRGKSEASGLFKMAFPNPVDRLWFPMTAYSTQALIDLKRRSLPMATKDILDVLIEWFDKLNDKLKAEDKIYKTYGTVAQIKECFFSKDNQIRQNTIKTAMERDIGIKRIEESRRYKSYISSAISVQNDIEVETVVRRNAYELNYYELVYARDGIELNGRYEQAEIFNN